MLLAQFNDFLLGFRGDHALAVQFTVRTRMRLVAGRKQVSRNITFGCNIGYNVDFLWDIGKLGKEFSLGVAFQNIFRNGVARFLDLPVAGSPMTRI